MRNILTIFLFLLAISAQANFVKQNPAAKTVEIADEFNYLQIQIDYSEGCKISKVSIKGKNTISPLGVYTSFKVGNDIFTSLDLTSLPKLNIEKKQLKASRILYGNDKMIVPETWIFEVIENQILWKISRQYLNNGKLDNMAIPVWNFNNLSPWTGGI